MSDSNLLDTLWRYVLVAASGNRGTHTLFHGCCPPSIPPLQAGRGIEVRALRFASPVMKLVEKTRTGSRVTKKYDKARTPYGRVLTSQDIAKRVKQDLRRDYKELNPVALGREIVSTPVSS